MTFWLNIESKYTTIKSGDICIDKTIDRRHPSIIAV